MIKYFVKLFKHQLRKKSLNDIPYWQRRIVQKVIPFTMSDIQRIVSTINAIEYIVHYGIEGNIVECGVWRGGQMMAAAMTLKHLNENRNLILFDTFTGMTNPETVDVDIHGCSAQPVYEASLLKSIGKRWCEASITDVMQNIESTGYPTDLVEYVVGPVEETIPKENLSKIAYLRLDTDWYSSTLHELTFLYPLVVRYGVVCIDDYGHWQGARKATDEYITSQDLPIFLHRIDYSGRQFIKP